MELIKLEKTLSTFVKYYLYKHGINPNDFDDFMNEARLAAHYAIKSYRDDKATKLKTYIMDCVKNRFIDIRKNRFFQFHNGSIELWEDSQSELEVQSNRDPIAEFEHDNEIRSNLGDRDLMLYRKIFVEGYFYKELKREKISEIREAQSCFSRTIQAFSASVKNRGQISTSRGLRRELNGNSLSLQKRLS